MVSIFLIAFITTRSYMYISLIVVLSSIGHIVLFTVVTQSPEWYLAYSKCFINIC